MSGIEPFQFPSVCLVLDGLTTSSGLCNGRSTRIMRFLGFLLVFIIGGAIGLYVGGVGGAGVGALASTCDLIDMGVTNGSLTQQAANSLLGAQIDKLNLGDQRAAAIEQAKKLAKPGPCMTAFEALQPTAAPPPAQ
jgi:hypothetical protein